MILNAEEKKDLIKRANKIKGWLSDNEGIFLYQLARDALPGHIVEIGSYMGKSTWYLLSGANPETNRVYAVDTFTGIPGDPGHYPSRDYYEAFLLNMAWHDKVDNLITFKAESVKAASYLAFQSCSLIFIDGDHSYQGVCSDFEEWKHNLMYGGIIAFHDCNNKPEVLEFINRVLAEEEDFQILGFKDSIVYAVKGPKTILDKAQQELILARLNAFVRLGNAKILQPFRPFLRKIHDFIWG